MAEVIARDVRFTAHPSRAPIPGHFEQVLATAFSPADDCDPGQGFGAHLLHEEPDHTLAIFAGAWLQGRGAPPHNHGTWAVVGGVIGVERNTLWTRIDDGSRAGYAEVRRQEERVLGLGDVLTLQPDSIHSVISDTTSVTISFHVCGKHVNHTERSQFDPEQHTEQGYIWRQSAYRQV